MLHAEVARKVIAATASASTRTRFVKILLIPDILSLVPRACHCFHNRARGGIRCVDVNHALPQSLSGRCERHSDLAVSTGGNAGTAGVGLGVVQRPVIRAVLHHETVDSKWGLRLISQRKGLGRRGVTHLDSAKIKG